MTQTANLVLRVLALILIVTGVVIGLTAGWAGGLGPIVVGLALLVVDEATRRRRPGQPGHPHVFAGSSKAVDISNPPEGV